MKCRFKVLQILKILDVCFKTSCYWSIQKCLHVSDKNVVKESMSKSLSVAPLYPVRDRLTYIAVDAVILICPYVQLMCYGIVCCRIHLMFVSLQCSAIRPRTKVFSWRVSSFCSVVFIYLFPFVNTNKYNSFKYTIIFFTIWLTCKKILLNAWPGQSY